MPTYSVPESDAERFPVDARTDDVRAALREARSCVLVAPPGSGKTTRVPLRLLDEEYLAGRKVVMLEPRRLAARMAARWMARSIGQDVGRTVGYRTRMDSRVGRDTRLEVVTEGILTRILQDDPALEGVGLVVFDEFHERNLQADLALALVLDARATLRDDLRVLVMSATIDAPRVAALLSDPPAPVVECQGKTFDVETRYANRPPRDREWLDERAARAVRRALSEEAGSVLVFLPGEGEIRRTAKRLADGGLPADVTVAPLYGALSREEQDRAVAPAPRGARKVVLATSIAESSLTIEGIRVVVDAGKMRRPAYSPLTGMTRLVTLPVSRASADQRRGRAGRLEPGVCYRLWTSAEDASLAAFTGPEVGSADLAPLALELARWGTASDELRWMSPPPAAALARARQLLQLLEAVDDDGRITDAGTGMLALPVHPRLAHMILSARDDDETALACDLAALLGERDVLASAGRDAPRDIRTRLDALRGATSRADRGALSRVRVVARDLRKRVGVESGVASDDAAGRLLASAYPDRVARRRAGEDGRYLMANGRGARVPAHDELARSVYLAVASLDGDGTEAGVYLAAPLGEQDVRELFADRLESRDVVRWDRESGCVVARHEVLLGAVALETKELRGPPSDLVAAALVEGIRERGIHVLPWDRDTRAWQARVRFLHGVDADAWPDVSDEALTETLSQWLAPFVSGMTKLAHLRDVKLQDALSSLVGWRSAREVDRLAPTHVEVPSGARVRVDYDGERPALPVQVQKMFGCTETPRIAGGRVPLVLRLLSPAQRPVQITDDLASFWKNAYPEIRKELRGRYPKHPWPEDPEGAKPTNRAKRRRP